MSDILEILESLQYHLFGIAQSKVSACEFQLMKGNHIQMLNSINHVRRCARFGTICTIKKMENTHGRVLFKVKLLY